MSKKYDITSQGSDQHLIKDKPVIYLHQGKQISHLLPAIIMWTSRTMKNTKIRKQDVYLFLRKTEIL